MGAFRLAFECDGRVAGCIVPNTWMYRAHDLLFTGAFGDPTSSTKYNCEIGIAGPVYQSRDERPIDFSTTPYSVDPRNALADYNSDFGMEAGLPAQDARDCEAYSRVAVTWTITRSGNGTLMASQWPEWVSRIPWDKLGSDKPPNYDTELFPTGPRYHEPFKWVDVKPWENSSQDYPWAIPQESPRYWDTWTWTDLASVTHTETPQSGFPACPSGVTYGLWGLSGFPIGQVYVAVKRDSMPTWEILAVAEIHRPAWWRRSGKIAAQYAARWG